MADVLYIHLPQEQERAGSRQPLISSMANILTAACMLPPRGVLQIILIIFPSQFACTFVRLWLARTTVQRCQKEVIIEIYNSSISFYQDPPGSSVPVK